MELCTELFYAIDHPYLVSLFFADVLSQCCDDEGEGAWHEGSAILVENTDGHAVRKQ